MKAYQVSYLRDKDKVNLGHDLVYGNNIAQAKHNFFNKDSLLKTYNSELNQTNTIFGRLEELDNTEHLAQKEIVEKLIQECNWHWTINGKQYTKDNFNKQEFEKVFAGWQIVS